MLKKIITLSAGQIIMWLMVSLADMISYSGNYFIQFICIFIAPVCLLVKYSMMWMVIHLCDKKEELLKWIVQYVIFLVIWWLETYFIVVAISKLIQADKWIMRYEGFFPGIIYGWWGSLAVTIVTVAVIMHILCTIIKYFGQYEISHKIINVLLVMGMIVSIFFGEAYYDKRWVYFIPFILVVLSCFFFNWCYYKVQ